jgi:murein DD-endopeptidase MepM/ murein hydrolase activator NlpD
VVRGFDPPQSRFGTGHRGVDLAGRPGQPVRAAVSGEVTYAGRVGGRGVVVVDHGGTRTTYEPVAAVTRVGDLVRAGSVIGRLQLLGSHCFPAACLHWGLIEGRAHYLDPLTLVGAEPVVLLPLDSGPALAAVPASPVRRAAAGGRAGVEPWTAGTQDAVCRPPLACRPTVILWLFPPDTGLRRGDEPAGRPVVAGPW